MNAQRVRWFLALSAALFSRPGVMEAQADFWQRTNGPYGGAVNAIAVDSSGHIFAGEPTGRIMVSADQGQHWMNLTESPAPDLNTILIAPNDHIFAGTMTGIYRSTNGGGSWTPRDSGLTRNEIYDLACDRQGNLYAASYYGGVYKSTDNGDTWMPLGLIYVGSLFATPSGELFAGTNVSLFKYAGSTWTQAGPPGTTVIAIAVNTAGHIFVSTYYSAGGVLRSTDAGAHWTQTNAGLPQNSSVTSLFINPAGTIFAGLFDVHTNRQGVYSSTDNGNSWNLLDVPQAGILAQSEDGDLYAGGNGVYRSTDGGVVWSQTHYTSLSVYSMATGSTNALLAGTGEGLFRSTDAGSSWQPLPFLHAGLMATNTGGDVFGASSTVSRSSDNGSTWSPTNTQWESVYANAIAVSPNGAIFASAVRSITPCPCTPGLYRTTDNGNNWSRLSVDSLVWSGGAIGIHPLSGEVFASSWIRVYRSTDNGNLWRPVLTTTSAIGAIGVTPDDVALVAADSGAVYRSIDHGGTWSRIVVATTPVHSIVVRTNGQVFASTDNGVFRSTTGGLTWTQLNDGLEDSQVLSLAVDSSGYLYAGSGGLGVFRSRNTLTSYSEENARTPVAFRLEQNYPNPFNPSTRIAFAIESVKRGKGESENVTLKVFDVLGREVAVLVNEKKSQGEYSIAFDASDLSSGVYYYRLSAGGFVQTKKMLLIR